MKLVRVAKFACVAKLASVAKLAKSFGFRLLPLASAAKLAKSFGFRILPPKLLASFATFAALVRFATFAALVRFSLCEFYTVNFTGRPPLLANKRAGLPEPDLAVSLFQLVKVTTAPNIPTSFASNLT